MSDELDVEEVMKQWRNVAGEQAQQIVMLRAALAKATRSQAVSQDATASPPVPDTN